MDSTLSKKKELLVVKNLEIALRNSPCEKSLVSDVSFNILENEILAVVGESGSGKSITALSLMGLLDRRSLQVVQGDISFEGNNLLELSPSDLRKIRGSQIAMVFQEPMTALNPTMRCGDQVFEIIALHNKQMKVKDIKARVLELFEKVNLPDVSQVYTKYPHELSGGQKQRVVIAMAISCNPKLLIADEPTTALDVTVQRQIIDLLLEIQKKTKMSVLFISHDLSLVQSIAARVMVMYKGKVVELADSREVFDHSKNDYTKALMAAKPPLDIRLEFLPTVEDFYLNRVKTKVVSLDQRKQAHLDLYKQKPILRVVNVTKDYIKKSSLFKRTSFTAVDKVSFDLYPGETLGLVGESGCGKSTLSSLILQLSPVSSGEILYKDVNLVSLTPKQVRRVRKDIQIIFQDPYSSLNPLLTVKQTILEPIKIHQNDLSLDKQLELVSQILRDVGLDDSALDKYPHEFSGGQRQRIGIARSLAVKPKIIICDESVSALDISVQAQVLNLLNQLKQIYGFTYLFISHDLAVVKYMSDRIMVMEKGKIVEIQEADLLYVNPEKQYTKTLINSMIG
ncbi:dipeptide ABC transporter ATP-binding protein [Myroides sp. LJL119]